MTLRLAVRRARVLYSIARFPEERGINAAHVSVSSVPTGPVAAVYYPGRQTRHTWQSAICSIEPRATGSPVQSSTLSASKPPLGSEDLVLRFLKKIVLI